MAVIEYSTPGVYIEEIANGARPIQAVGTRTAGFVGKAPNLKKSPLTAVAISSWTDFVKRFMSPTSEEAAAGEQAARSVKFAKSELVRVLAGDVNYFKMEAQENANYEEALRAWTKARPRLPAPDGAGGQPAAETEPVRKARTDLVKAIVADANNEQDVTVNQAINDWKLAQAALDNLAAQQDVEADVKALAQAGVAQAEQSVIDAKADQVTQYQEFNAAIQTWQEKDRAVTAKASDAARTALQTAQGQVVTLMQQQVAAVEAANKVRQQSLTYKSTDLSDAVYGFFLNGGSRCYVVNLGTSNLVKDGLDVLAQVDEVAIVAAPGYTDVTSYEAIRTHCDTLKDRVGILDCPKTLSDEEGADQTAADDVKQKLMGEKGGGGAWQMPQRSEYGQITLYAPWIRVSDPEARPANGSGPKTKPVPPSGYMAGIWARSDAVRGVHKAPANESVRGALGLTAQITHDEQGLMNKKGVNVIRYFPNVGYLVWGARTLAKDETSVFRFLNVRRLFNMIEESIQESTRWIVFEPNDRPLWQAIRRDVTAFLMGFWRDGALMGPTPQEAFYVKCDDETNPMDSRREGKVIIEIGLAPVLPAEFVIFRISQYESGTEIEMQRG